MSSLAYCTILAQNYLPSALALNDSLLRFDTDGPGRAPLHVMLIDATPQTELPAIEGVRWMTPWSLDLPERTMLELMMSYDLVEFATAIKPLVFRKLLAEHEQVAYLDPDTYQLSPMDELSPALRDGAGIVLTPHYVEPVPLQNAFSEGHLLVVGVYNLGFCAVDRRAGAMLDWWWSHLRSECIHDPIAGLFVDQKWMDIGAVLFDATSLQHRGYNVSVANLHERPIARDEDGYYVASSGDRLRLFHFHAFDPLAPEALYTRRRTAAEREVSGQGEALRELAEAYAAIVLEKRALLGPAPAYRYNSDTTGRRISRRMRHAYRVAVAADPRSVPSPFVAAEAADYERWRRSTKGRGLAAKLILSDVAKGLRCAMPEEYGTLKRRLPGLTRALRERYVEDSGMWG
jgi:hypothetical protein